MPERVPWRTSVRNAILYYARTHETRLFTRQQLIKEQLRQIKAETHTNGRTPSQTLSRVLQGLRDEGFLEFNDDRGTYLVVDAVAGLGPVNLDEVDLPDALVEAALRQNRPQNIVVKLGDVPTLDEQVLARRRRGQNSLRKCTLFNYDYACAFCDIDDELLLITSHIVRWADDIENRGNLRNTICLCTFHDSLFEKGYVSLSDDYSVVKKENVKSIMLQTVLIATATFRLPKDASFLPDPQFLKRHRERHGLE